MAGRAASGYNSSDTRKLAEFVRLNRTVLLAHWNGDIDTPDLFDGMRRID